MSLDTCRMKKSTYSRERSNGRLYALRGQPRPLHQLTSKGWKAAANVGNLGDWPAAVYFALEAGLKCRHLVAALSASSLRLTQP